MDNDKNNLLRLSLDALISTLSLDILLRWLDLIPNLMFRDIEDVFSAYLGLGSAGSGGDDPDYDWILLPNEYSSLESELRLSVEDDSIVVRDIFQIDNIVWWTHIPTWLARLEQTILVLREHYSRPIYSGELREAIIVLFNAHHLTGGNSDD